MSDGGFLLIYRSSRMEGSGASFRASISRGRRSINWMRTITCGNASADDLRLNDPARRRKSGADPTYLSEVGF